jgi:phosphotriesterase-related protein
VDLPVITTVLGDIDAAALGPCSIHEHVLCDMTVYLSRLDSPPRLEPVSLSNLADVRADHGAFADNLRLDSVADMQAEVAAFAAAGGGALVEVSVPGIRTDVAALRQISAATGVHIVASTGLYIQDSWPERFAHCDEAALYDFMVGETFGIGDSGVRAGHIGELGVSDLAEPQRRLLRAAARASEDTGLSVSVHISDPRDATSASGLEVARFLLKAGCNPARTIIAHVDYTMVETRLGLLAERGGGRTPDYAYARELLELGFCVSVDSFGWEHYLPAHMRTGIQDWERVDIVRQLVQDGYGDRVMLGTDTALKHLCRAYGGCGYRNLLSFVAPALREAGLSAEAVERLLVHNPARLLAR